LFRGILTIPPLAAAILLAGCANPSVVFVTGTSIGIEATAEEGTEQRVVLGYKRFEGAVIPTTYEEPVNKKNGATNSENATPIGEGTNESLSPSNGSKPEKIKRKLREKPYSVYAALGLDNGFFATSVYQVYATGDAAKLLAASPEGLSAVAMERKFNADTLDLQTKFDAWLEGDTDGARRSRLRAFLAGKGVRESEATWISSAGRADLESAAAALGVP